MPRFAEEIEHSLLLANTNAAPSRHAQMQERAEPTNRARCVLRFQAPSRRSHQTLRVFSISKHVHLTLISHCTLHPLLDADNLAWHAVLRLKVELCSPWVLCTGTVGRCSVEHELNVLVQEPHSQAARARTEDWKSIQKRPSKRASSFEV